MGLDMYLSKRRYVKNWEHFKPEQRHSVIVRKGDKVVKSKFPIKEVVYEVAYWRKANAIHNWFVENTQGGNDQNGEESYVSLDQLEELLDLCKKVKATAKMGKGMVQNGATYDADKKEWVPIMEEGETVLNPEEINNLLPPQSGFFFGSTDIDQYYMDDIDRTIEQLEKVLAEDEGDEYYYQSSW